MHLTKSPLLEAQVCQLWTICEIHFVRWFTCYTHTLYLSRWETKFGSLTVYDLINNNSARIWQYFPTSVLLSLMKDKVPSSRNHIIYILKNKCVIPQTSDLALFKFHSACMHIIVVTSRPTCGVIALFTRKQLILISDGLVFVPCLILRGAKNTSMYREGFERKPLRIVSLIVLAVLSRHLHVSFCSRCRSLSTRKNSSQNFWTHHRTSLRMSASSNCMKKQSFANQKYTGYLKL